MSPPVLGHPGWTVFTLPRSGKHIEELAGREGAAEGLILCGMKNLDLVLVLDHGDPWPIFP